MAHCWQNQFGYYGFPEVEDCVCQSPGLESLGNLGNPGQYWRVSLLLGVSFPKDSTLLVCNILTGELEAWRVIPRMAVDLSSSYPVPEVFLQGAEVPGTSLTVFATSASSGRMLL